MTELFDVTNNLLRGPIPEYLFQSFSLHTIRMSKNRFEGTISPSFSRLRNLYDLQISENRLTGTLPQSLFEVSSIKSIILNNNKIGGSLPSEIGNLSNLKTVMLNHNSLKGTIPIQMENLTEINIVQLDHNQLTGNAPRFARRLQYSTDCGAPNFELSNPLECETCDRCCNSNGDCKDVEQRFIIPPYSLALFIAVLSAAFVSLVVFVMKMLGYHSNKDKDLSVLYAEDSTNSLVFSKKTSARVIYATTIILQTLLFLIYLIDSERIKYSMNISVTNWHAWLSFSLVIFCFLGADLVMSVSQLREGFLLNDKSLFVGGAVLLYITIVALTTSFFYCSMSVESNTELIVEAIVLLFIMDLDDRIFAILNKAAPIWTQEVKEEVQQKYQTRFRKYLQRQAGSRRLAV